MKNLKKIFIYLFKKYSPLRIFQIIESNNISLKGKSLEFGAYAETNKNFSYHLRSSGSFEFTNLKNDKKNKIIGADLGKKLKFKSNYYDNLIIFNVLEHLNNPSKSFKELNRILKKNGFLIGSTPFLYQIHGAPNDYLIHLLKIWDTVHENYYSGLTNKIQIICEAYANGINRYCEKNPDKILGKLYPVKGKDIIAGFVYRTPLMYELDWYIKKILTDDKQPEFSYNFNKNYSLLPMYGSNVFAVGPNRSSDGHTRIAINSHQPWSGPVAWYEAHLNSKEGLDVTGGLFPGSPVIFKGHNQNIAWSHTVNDPDLVDVYKLVINSEDENQYLLDGEWVNFEDFIAPIKVKLWGPFSWTFNRQVLWSKHGPVLKTNHGHYAIRFSGYNLVGQLEQWYNMNKSNSLVEFQDAMKMMQIPMFNTLYADKEGNLFYIYNGLIPKRIDGYDWDEIVPGDQSELIWNEYYSYMDLPQLVNPKSGFLQNCNSTPYLASLNKDNTQLFK